MSQSKTTVRLRPQAYDRANKIAALNRFHGKPSHFIGDVVSDAVDALPEPSAPKSAGRKSHSHKTINA